MFGDVNVKVEDGNLGRSSSTGTGTSIKIGISNVESKSPILISGTMNAKKIKEKVGNTPLADACIDAVEWAKKVEKLGAGEILLTSMDGDGTKAGFDLELTRAVSDSVSIPVIASGGGNLQHLVDGIVEGHADAVLAASIFHFGEYTIEEAKRYMQERGIPVRLD